MTPFAKGRGVAAVVTELAGPCLHAELLMDAPNVVQVFV